jgi:protein-S-isoprenylcysteine O-methyltransferase Ste14
MHPVIVVIGIGWAVFWIGWLIAAFTAKTSRDQSSLGSALRIGMVVAAGFFVRLSWRGEGHQVGTGPALAGIGLALWAAGLALAIWARIYIGRNWGMPMSKREQPDLVTTGPYRSIRHPIYTGLIVAFIGTALATSLLGLIVAAVITVFFGYSATREEKFLAEQFPATFPPYKAETKMLIPFILLSR